MTTTLPKEVRVRGMAVPFGVPNSYNETLAPGALDEFVARVNRKGLKLPMGFMHEIAAGEWDKLEVRPDGLYVEGVITSPDVIGYLNKVTFGTFTGELSITFQDQSHDDGQVYDTRERFNTRNFPRNRELPRWLHIVDANVAKKVKLTEISLVDSGAFHGTHFEPVSV